MPYIEWKSRSKITDDDGKNLRPGDVGRFDDGGRVDSFHRKDYGDRVDGPVKEPVEEREEDQPLEPESEPIIDEDEVADGVD